ncbi:hypothetical protein ETH_00009285, partial [Eimeria tenella]
MAAQQPVQVLELYSGIGGMHCGLLHAQKLRLFRSRHNLKLNCCCCGAPLPAPAPNTSPRRGSAKKAAAATAAAAAGCCCLKGIPAPGSSGSAPLDCYEGLTAHNIPLDGSSYCVHPLLDEQPHTAAAAAAAAAAQAAAPHSSSSSGELPFQLVAAVDISDSACAVYRGNFCRLPQQQQQQRPEHQAAAAAAAAEGALPKCLSADIGRLPL